MNEIRVINKWFDTNSVVFEYRHLIYICDLPTSVKVLDLTEEQLMEHIESYIECNLIQKAA